jgi:hypothetical protein
VKLRKFFKLKRENFIIIFSTGQILSIRLALVIHTMLKRIHKPKYDFNVN